MRLVYAQQFRIATPPEIVGAPVPVMLKADVAEWIQQWYKRWQGHDFHLPVSSNVSSPLPHHSVETTFMSAAGSGPIHEAVTWRYPSEADDRLFWESRCEWASMGGDTEFSFLLRIASREFVIAPPHFDIRRPRIVRSIVNKYRCFSGDQPLSHQPEHVGVQDLDCLAGALVSQKRRLPIVLFSVEPHSEKTLADPQEAQDTLVGLAHVVVLQDKWTAFALTDCIGKVRSCFNGAVRVYWPGFGPNADPFGHPVLLPDRIRSIQAEGRSLSDHLLRWFAPMSTLRFAYGPITVAAGSAVLDARSREIATLRRTAEEAGNFGELLKLADDDIATLKRDNEELARRLADAEAELATARANIGALSITQAAEPHPGVSSAAPELEPGSVREAVDVAADRFTDTLVFLAGAFDSADESPYGQPDKVLQALEAMDDVCRAWRASLERKESMGPMESAFGSRGFIYKAGESQTAAGKWGEEYLALYNGVRVPIETHLALGKGRPDTCLRIHFYRDEARGRFVVAHVGRHKTNTKT